MMRGGSAAAGVQTKDLTWELIHKSEPSSAALDVDKRQRLMKAGDVAAAHVLMDKLKDNGIANARHFNIMLRACEDSTEMRHVIGTEMLAARVEPGVVTCNTLVAQLLVEGDAAGAQRGVEEEMPAAGVQPDDRILETLQRPEPDLAKTHTGRLTP